MHARVAPRALVPLVTVALLLSACESGGNGDEDGTAAATTTSVSTTTTTTLPPKAFPARPGRPLAKGTGYTTEALDGVTLTFTVPADGWVTDGADSNLVSLRHGKGVSQNGTYLAFILPERVQEAPSCASARDRRPKRLPADLAQWLAGHACLDAGDPKAASIGGLEGSELQGPVSAAPRPPTDACRGRAGGTAPCVIFFHYGEQGFYRLWLEHEQWFAVLQAGERQLVVLLETPKGQLDRRLSEVRGLLDTLDVELGETS